MSTVSIACVASLTSLTQPEQLPLTLKAEWSFRTQESLSKASDHRGEGPRGSLRSVGAKLLACDPFIAAAIADRLHCVGGQRDETAQLLVTWASRWTAMSTS